MSELVLQGFRNIHRNIEWIYSVWFLIILVPLSIWFLDPTNILPFVETAFFALSNTLPYIAIAVLLLGYLKASGAETIVAKAFEGRESRMIVMAALFGGLAPFCSCEVIPFVAGLLAVGAPLSAVMAFWLSSPLIDPPTLLITASALGWTFSIAKAIAAVALGLIGGFAVRHILTAEIFSNPLKPGTSFGGCCGGPAPFSGTPRWPFWKEPERREIFARQSLENAFFLLKWLSFAYLLEAVLIHYVPAEIIAIAVGGDGILPIITGAMVGAPAYVNSYAAPPLVAGLVEQGMTQGAAMAFMIAGAVSSIPAMAAVWSLVRGPIFLAYLGLGISGAILIGSIFQFMVS